MNYSSHQIDSVCAVQFQCWESIKCSFNEVNTEVLCTYCVLIIFFTTDIKYFFELFKKP